MDREQIISKLNKEQQEAVLASEGPVLILAGAGSGKTRVLVHRIAYLIDVCGVAPYNILAITFTNKAAEEMRQRVDDMIGFGAGEIWVMTFHACCVRILRRHAEEIGFTRYFSIYDRDDQESVMKDILKRRKIDPKVISHKAVLNAISSAKDELITPEKYARLNKEWGQVKIADLYAEYQDKLKENNAMDFDDLISRTVALFEERPDILELYRRKFQYISVDEYQDTNTAQFRLVKLLADEHRNLCVVGDDDQSIYKFRGANIRNILNFEEYFPDAKVVKLERNYRSTQNILNAANEVIRHNRGRKSKRLWTDVGDGEKIRFKRYETGYAEAEAVAREIAQAVGRRERHYKDYAVLYRTNAQSRLFEEKCLLLNVPYKLVGGVNFYSRREIKDVLAYLKTIDNAVDDVASTRIINVPKRGIGATTITKIATYAADGGISFFDAAAAAKDIPGLSSATAKKVAVFTDFIAGLRRKSGELKVSDLIGEILNETGYLEALQAEGTEEAEDRLDNLDELRNKAVQYEENADSPSLSGFLEEVALIADIDTVDDNDDRVLLMTLHAAKGLEFPVVYMTGMEEGIFPSAMSINSSDSDEEVEEERRLCYVGITRAREQLTMTMAYERMMRGEMHPMMPSRFIHEMPREVVDLGKGSQASRTKPDLGNAGFGRSMREAITAKPYAPKPGNGAFTGAYGRSDEDMNSGYSSAYSRSGADRNGGAYSSPYKSPYSKPAQNKSSAPASASSGRIGSGELGYEVGDKVRHVKFGVGTVREIRNMGRDHQVTVDFPSWGVKKLLAGFAKLVREE